MELVISRKTIRRYPAVSKLEIGVSEFQGSRITSRKRKIGLLELNDLQMLPGNRFCRRFRDNGNNSFAKARLERQRFTAEAVNPLRQRSVFGRLGCLSRSILSLPFSPDRGALQRGMV